jgi:TolB-like protein
MKKILYTIFILLGVVHAQETIAVIDLETVGVNQTVSPTLSNIIRKTLMSSNRFVVIDRNQTDEILKEQGFQQSGCVSAECAVEVGKMLGVKFILSGTISKLGEMYIIDLQMLDVGTGKIIKLESEQFVGKIEELIQPIKMVTNRIAGVKDKSILKTGNSIFITSDPVGAEAYLDGNFIGNTPVKVPINKSTVNVRVSLNGFSTWEQKVSLIEKSQNIVKATLVIDSGSINSQVEKGYIKIKGTISGWNIYIDGGMIGKTPFNDKIELAVGKHKVSFFDDNHIFPQGTAMTDMKYSENQKNAAVKNIFVQLNEDVEIDFDSMITKYNSVLDAHRTNALMYWGCWAIGFALILKNVSDENAAIDAKYP